MDVKRISAFFFVIIVSLGVIAWTSPDLVRNVKLGLDLQGGFEILYVAEPITPGSQITPEALRETARSLEKRANSTGVAEPEIFPEGKDRIRARIAGVTEETKVREMLKRPAELTFRSAEGCENETDYCKIELYGNEFVENGASVGYDELNRPIVHIQVKNKQKFAEITGRLVGKPLAIYLDDTMLSDPVVQQPLTDGNATITGNYTIDEARELRDVINLGALPLKLTEKYTQSVGATLGAQSLEQTLRASVIASILIFLFMVVFYRVPGLVAGFCLVTYVWLILLVFNLADVTLTLPGIAAFVLGVGMAVDANIITYERIKEEIRSGKSILSAVKAGSKSSFRTIMDANLTSILAAIVLYYMGTGSVQGFALVLIMNIVGSILTNVFLSRLLLILLVRGKLAQKSGYFGVKESEIRAL
jgi:SecD/SecF fusion protein